MQINGSLLRLVVVLRCLIVISLLLQLVAPAMAVSHTSISDPSHIPEQINALNEQQSTGFGASHGQSLANEPSSSPNGNSHESQISPNQDMEIDPLADLPLPMSTHPGGFNIPNPLASIPEFAQPEMVDTADFIFNIFDTPLNEPMQIWHGPANNGVATHQLFMPFVANAPEMETPLPPAQTGIIRKDIGGTIQIPNYVSVEFSGYGLEEDVLITILPQEGPALLNEGVFRSGPAFKIEGVGIDSGLPIIDFPHQIIVQAFENDEYPTILPGIIISSPFDNELLNNIDIRTMAFHSTNEYGSWQKIPTEIHQENENLVSQVEKLSEFIVLGEGEEDGTDEVLTIVLDPDDNEGSATMEGNDLEELILNYELSQRIKSNFEETSCNVNVIITRDTSQNYVDRNTRANFAVVNDADIFLTIAFNGLIGRRWGYEGNGGYEGWVREGQPENESNLFFDITEQLDEFTGRRLHRFRNYNKYIEYNALPDSTTYVHLEVLFMDHWHDYIVIRDGFSSIADGIYNALLADLLERGLVCDDGDDEDDNDGDSLFKDPPDADTLARWRNLGIQGSQVYGGDPVSFSTGNFVHEVQLFHIPNHGGFDLDFDLFYNSQDGRDSIFGTNWSSDYTLYVQRYSDDSASVRLGDGSTYHYEFDGSEYIAPAGMYADLQMNDDGWVWTTREGIIYTFKDTVGGLATIESIVDRNGNEIEIEHDESVLDNWMPGDDIIYPPLEKISVNSLRDVEFEHQGGKISRIILPDSREINFTYFNGNLATITDANGGTVKYGYDAEGRMTHLTDAQDILYLQNAYDSENRVIGQVDASGSINSFVYSDDPKQTIYTDNEGNVFTYLYDDLFRVTFILHGGIVPEQFVYDDAYNLTSYIDSNLIEWEYEYDTFGNRTLERDPDNFEISFEYNEFNDVVLMLDQGGPGNSFREMVYEYDETGNLTKIIHFDQTETNMNYDGFGNMILFSDQNENAISYTYDEYGNLIDFTNAENETVEFEYDLMGRQTVIRDANGHVISFVYDNNDNIVLITDPKGVPTLLAYDLNNNLTQIIDRRGGVTRYEYDENLKLAQETSPEGRATKYDYDKMYNLISMTDPNGNITQYGYDEIYRLIWMEDAIGGVVRFEYDSNGNIVSTRDALQQETMFRYDELNRLERIIDPLNGTTVYEYDAVGRQTKITNARFVPTHFGYDLEGRLISIIDGDNNEYRIEHDGVGNVISMTDPLSRTVEFVFDGANRLTHQFDAAGNPTLFEHDNVGNVISVTNALSQTTTFSYDKNDNLISIVNAEDGKTEYSYTAEDDLAITIDANGNPTSYKYDLDGLLISMLEAGGQLTQYEYDIAGNLVEVINARGKAWQYTYDRLNRRVSMKDPLDHITLYGYDGLSRLTTITDANGVTTRYEYDALDRLIKVIQNERIGFPMDAYNNVMTEYGYDLVGNLTSIKDGNGHITEFIYDELNRLSTEIDPLLVEWQYEYDAVGNLVLRKDGNEVETVYQYNENDLLRLIDYPGDDEDVEFVYDEVYNLKAVLDGVRDNQFEYDDLNRLSSVTNDIDGVVGYAYDPVGNRTELIYPNERSAEYEYDETNRLMRMEDGLGSEIFFDYSPTHLLTEIAYPNDYTLTHIYDDADRLVGVHNVRKDRVLALYDYTLDSVGNRIQTVETLNERLWKEQEAFLNFNVVEVTHEYNYDRLYRLTEVMDTFPDANGETVTRLAEYEFDKVGNRDSLTITGLGEDGFGNGDNGTQINVTTIDYDFNDANQLESANGTTYEYDGNGNRISEISEAETISYTYDYENRLVRVEICPIDEDDCGVTESVFDGLGRRVEKRGDGPHGTFEHIYVFDGLEVIQEYQHIPSQDVRKMVYHYYRGAGRILEMVCQERCNQSDRETRIFFHYDGLGSAIAFSARNGQLLSGNRYDEFGQSLNDKFGLFSGFSYTGQEFDSSTSFYHFYAREFDVSNGIWLQQDSYRGENIDPRSIHRYAYAFNNALRYQDYLGFKTYECPFIGPLQKNDVRSCGNNDSFVDPNEYTDFGPIYNFECEYKYCTYEQRVSAALDNHIEGSLDSITILEEAVKAAEDGKIDGAGLAVIFAKYVDRTGRYRDEIVLADTYLTLGDIATLAKGANSTGAILTIVKCSINEIKTNEPCGREESEAIVKLANAGVKQFGDLVVGINEQTEKPIVNGNSFDEITTEIIPRNFSCYGSLIAGGFITGVMNLQNLVANRETEDYLGFSSFIAEACYQN